MCRVKCESQVNEDLTNYDIYLVPGETVDITENEIIDYVSDITLYNYPNPFNPEVNISFSTTEITEITEINIYNVKGQKVKTLINEVLTAGVHSIIWHGENERNQQVGSGVYFYQLKAGDVIETRKMMLIK